MEKFYDLSSFQQGKHPQRASWGGNDFSNSPPQWEATPGTMSSWEGYTQAASHQGDCAIQYSPIESPTSPLSVPSAFNSPNVAVFHSDARFAPQPTYVGPPKPSSPICRRRRSANEVSLRKPKITHTISEKMYRDRLKDNINELGIYLFEPSSLSHSRHTKSDIVIRAKERLEELESRNKSLESEVVELRQNIAMLDNIAASSRGEAGPSSLSVTGF